MKYHIFTLGCQMNESDSERIKYILNSIGLKSALTDVEADLVIVNACSVRQSAVDRIYGNFKKWRGKKVYITGCVLPLDKKKLAPKVEKIFPITDLGKLPKWLGKKGKHFKNYFLIQAETNPNIDKPALVPIMTGCNNFCAYCAVPYVRGREISRPEKEIICEVKNFIIRGKKEIILLGQNVNRYKNNKEKFAFVILLKKLVKIPGDFKIKFMSANPWDFLDELIELISKEPKLSKEIHLPLQSGDNGILRKMNRPYSREEYLKLIKNLKLKIKNLSLSTDIIVGFPGETKKAFENTLKLCKKAQFQKAYVAQYSPRPGTSAAKQNDNIPKQEKKRRWKILNDFINKN